MFWCFEQCVAAKCRNGSLIYGDKNPLSFRFYKKKRHLKTKQKKQAFIFAWNHRALVQMTTKSGWRLLCNMTSRVLFTIPESAALPDQARQTAAGWRRSRLARRGWLCWGNLPAWSGSPSRRGNSPRWPRWTAAFPERPVPVPWQSGSSGRFVDPLQSVVHDGEKSQCKGVQAVQERETWTIT